MNIFQKFFQSTRFLAKALLLSLLIAALQIRIRQCKRRLQASPRDPDTIRNLKDELFAYQIEAQSLNVRVHRLMAARKLKEQSARDRLDEWKG